MTPQVPESGGSGETGGLHRHPLLTTLLLFLQVFLNISHSMELWEVQRPRISVEECGAGAIACKGNYG